MAAVDGNELSGSVGLDTTAFKRGAGELNSQIKSIETSFRASAVIMGDWGDKSDGVRLRTESLSKKMELQKEKLSILLEEYNKATTAEEKNQKAIDTEGFEIITFNGRLFAPCTAV